MNRQHILITGGAGYLGSFLVEQFLALPQYRITVLSRDELKHFDLKIRLGKKASAVNFLIGDVRDLDRLKEGFKDVDLVIHAAAMKQVPVCEENPGECYKTNVQGTEHVIKAARHNSVSQLIFVSTDKAVEPVSVYGNSKQAGERLVLKANAESLRTSVVRLGNLIGSPGSIVDLIKKQQVKQINIFHPELTRFFDSLDNAGKLIQMLSKWQYQGVILLPKLKSIKVCDLVGAFDPTLEVRMMEERSFEKIHEKLATENELHRMVETSACYLITERALSNDQSLDAFKGLPVSISEYSSASVEKISFGEIMHLEK